jgi:hypothetical protein
MASSGLSMDEATIQKIAVEVVRHYGRGRDGSVTHQRGAMSFAFSSARFVTAIGMVRSFSCWW